MTNRTFSIFFDEFYFGDNQYFVVEKIVKSNGTIYWRKFAPGCYTYKAAEDYRNFLLNSNEQWHQTIEKKEVI